MSQTLTPRTLKAYAVVEALKNGSQDIRGAVLPFLHPLLAFMDGKVLSAARLAEKANEAYSWNLSQDVIEGIAPQLVESGWLTPIEENSQSVTYKVTCHLPDGAFHSNLSSEIRSLETSFKEYVNQKAPLFKNDYPQDDLLQLLLRWVVSLDVYDSDQLKRSIAKAEDGIIVGSPKFSPAENFICADFTKSLHEDGSDLFDVLVHVIEVGLLAEAAEDFANPTTSVKTTSLAVYIDAPVAMDFLNISGKDAHQNAKALLDRLKSMGASLRIFDDSVTEIQRNLRALFRRQIAERTGPTATAIRRREVLETYVSDVLARPAQALEALGVQVFSRTLESFPSEHKFFPETAYEDVYSQLTWHLEDAPRHHDALAVTNIMRLRKGKTATDTFESGALFLTKNPSLAQAAKRVARENGFLHKFSIGPVITQRQLATAVWLRGGLSASEKRKLPMNLLLASCERVLQLRPDVVAKSRAIAHRRGPDVSDQLDLLLTADRSTQFLMERTLNTPTVLDDGSFDEILNGMRESLIADKTKEFEADRIERERAHEDEKNTILRELDESTQRFSEALSTERTAREALEENRLRLANEDRIAVDALFVFVNAAIVQKRRRVRRNLAIGSAMLDLSSISLGIVTKNPTFLLGLLIGLPSLIPNVAEWLVEALGLGSTSQETAEAMLWVEAERRAINTKMKRADYEFRDEQFVFQGFKD